MKRTLNEIKVQNETMYECGNCGAKWFSQTNCICEGYIAQISDMVQFADKLQKRIVELEEDFYHARDISRED